MQQVIWFFFNCLCLQSAALSDDGVWADALLCFHELYKFFEQHLPEELLPKELHRTEAFEKDLTYFLG